MEVVSVNGALQSWPTAPLSLREMLFQQPAATKTLFFQREGEDLGTPFALQELLQQAEEWELISRFKLNRGDVVIVQSPNWLSTGVVAVLSCLDNHIPVLPISMDVSVHELYSVFASCTTGLNKLCFLSTRERLWEADYLLAQFHCVSGSLGGDGDWPPTCVSDLTCKTDPKLPKHYCAEKEAEACMLFYDEVTRTLLEATERNIVGFARTAAARRNNTNQVWKLHGLAWLGTILPFLCSSNDSDAMPLLFAAKRQITRIRRVHSPAAATAVQTEKSHLVELMLGLDQSTCNMRLAGDQLLVFGPCSFRQTLSKNTVEQQCGYVLDQATFSWWFAVNVEPGSLRIAQDGSRIESAMTTASSAQQQPKKLLLVKPVRRPISTARL